MKKRHLVLVSMAFLLFLSLGLARAQGPETPDGGIDAPMGTGFTYQGRLRDGGGSPVSSTCDFTFSLWDAASGGAQIGSDSAVTGVSVSDGYFAAEVNAGGEFGSDAFTGEARWLQIAVQCIGDANPVTLDPRQPLSAAPQARYSTAAPWSGLSGVPAGFADGVDDEGSYSAGTGLSLTGSEFALALPFQLPQSCANGQIAEWTGSTWACGDDDVGTGSGGGDITAVYAGTGLTGGGESGAVTLYADPTCLQRRVSGTCAAGNAIRVVNEDGTVTCEPVGGGGAHDHWGESWTGSGTGLALSGGTVGLEGSGSTRGLYGHSDTTSGYGQGVYGQTAADQGAGLIGWAAHTSGANYGAYGRSFSSQGTGVYGWASASSGSTYGVFGRSDSTDGEGVRGEGGLYAVHGYSASAHGVYGQSAATQGLTYGVYGSSDSPTGRGIYGFATAASGTTSGVYGRADSTQGRGVSGWASASSGETYGVYGGTNSTEGTGVYGWVSASSGTTYGVYGRSDSTDWGAAGVYGHATATGMAFNMGVYGLSESTDGVGVRGEGCEGVLGTSDQTWGHGVYGSNEATSGSAEGVYGSSDSTQGRGVSGYASASSGINYGVYGESNSPSGYGVYYVGGLGGTGLKTSIVETQDYGWRHLYSVESTGPWFEDFGSGQLADGRVIVAIDALFAQTVNLSEDYHVFLTPRGDCNGLYVAAVTATSFEVRELGSGRANVAFDYRIVAKRLGYEDVRLSAAAPPPPVEAEPAGGGQ